MKKNILTIVFLILTSFAFTVNAQSGANDPGLISLTAYVPQQVEKMPEAARSVLQNKLSQVISQNGLGNSAFNSRFIITANINVLTKDVTATAPPMVAMTNEISLFIGDGFDGKKFASTSITTKAVGTNETKAYIEAIKGIRPSDPAIQAFVNDGKNKIIDYYKKNCDMIIKQAQTAASMDNFEEAISNLSAVPEACKECWDKSQAAIVPIYKKYIDKDCRIKLGLAKTAWAASQNYDGANAAAEYLSSVNPDAACYKDVTAFTNEMARRVKEIDNREWAFTTKTTSDVIKAYRDIGVAYGNGQPKTVVYKSVW
jgi:hypothetical protein